jgi:formiminotetrahydrofolate cyclodeaminase
MATADGLEPTRFDAPLAQIVAAMAQPRPAPASGAALGAAAALAAALVEKVCALAREGELAAQQQAAAGLRAEAERFVEADERAYAQVARARGIEAGDVAGAWRAAALVPLAFAERCADLAELAADVAAKCREPLVGDARTGEALARAAGSAAALLAELDLAAGDGATAVDAERIARVRAGIAQLATGTS